MNLFFILAMALLTTACHRPSISCRSEYLYPLYLAAQQVNTPDPRRACFHGQQIITRWSLPRYSLNKPVELRLNVRYGNREMATFSKTLVKSKGFWVYPLLNKDYIRQCGIISFQAQLLQDGEVMSEWNHFLWADIIEIPED